MTVYEHAMIGINGALAVGLQRRHGWQIIALAVAVVVSNGGIVSAASYKAIDLGTLPGKSYTESSASGINARGQVAGASYSKMEEGPMSPDDRPVCHAFLYGDGKMIDLGTLPGGSFSCARGINSSGQVVGYADAPNGHRHAFLYSKGTMTDLGILDGSYITSSAAAINDNGQVVGESDTAENTAGERHAFLYQNGKMTDLGLLLGPKIRSGAYSINASGEVVGYTFEDSVLIYRAFLYSNGAMTRLGSLGGVSSCACSINARGQVAGDADTVGNAKTHAFLYDKGTMTDLGKLPGDSWSHATSINASGQVVGWAAVTGGGEHAVLYDKGEVIDLNAAIEPSAGWTLKSAKAINDSGWIVGDGIHNGAERAFLLTPIR